MSEEAVKEVIDFEDYPPDMPKDETDIAVRAYVGRFSDEKLAEFNMDWTEEEVMEWDENFRNDGGLMLVCCERDVEVDEYKDVIRQCREYRKTYGVSVS